MLDHFGAHLGPVLGHVRAILGHLGPSWGHLGAILGVLAAILGQCWAILAPFWGFLGPSCRPRAKTLIFFRFLHILLDLASFFPPTCACARAISKARRDGPKRFGGILLFCSPPLCACARAIFRNQFNGFFSFFYSQIHPYHIPINFCPPQNCFCNTHEK